MQRFRLSATTPQHPARVDAGKQGQSGLVTVALDGPPSTHKKGHPACNLYHSSICFHFASETRAGSALNTPPICAEHVKLVLGC